MLRSIRCVTATLAIMIANGSHAASTTVLASTGHEPGLTAANGILDNHFGLANLVRIDDSIDQNWRNDGRIMVKTVAKWAGFNQSFGYIGESGEFSQILSVNNRWSRPAGSFSANDSGEIFRFGLKPSSALLWTSAAADNSDAMDHMVTWRIIASKNLALIGAYVIAWEDLPGGGDGDFNDLIMLIKGDTSLAPDLPQVTGAAAPVPVPAALWLFGSGLLGLGMVFRQRKAT